MTQRNEQLMSAISMLTTPLLLVTFSVLLPVALGMWHSL